MSRSFLKPSATVGAAFVCLLLFTPPAFAVLPTGACCFRNGTCEVVTGFLCEEESGVYSGDFTSCELVECEASVAVPVFSIFGLVALFGALGSLGIYGLVRRRRREA